MNETVKQIAESSGATLVPALPGRELAGSGQFDLPIDVYSADAHDAVDRIETILAGNAP